MHPIKNLYDKQEDLTPKFKDICQKIIAEAQKAIDLADSDCPYPLEMQTSEILSLVREATQVAKTAADYYMMAIPDTEGKMEDVRAAWKKAGKNI